MAADGPSALGDGAVEAGDQALLTLIGTFEPDTIHPGHVIVKGGKVRRAVNFGDEKSFSSLFVTIKTLSPRYLRS